MRDWRQERGKPRGFMSQCRDRKRWRKEGGGEQVKGKNGRSEEVVRRGRQ